MTSNIRSSRSDLPRLQVCTATSVCTTALLVRLLIKKKKKISFIHFLCACLWAWVLWQRTTYSGWFFFPSPHGPWELNSIRQVCQRAVFRVPSFFFLFFFNLTNWTDSLWIPSCLPSAITFPHLPYIPATHSFSSLKAHFSDSCCFDPFPDLGF